MTARCPICGSTHMVQRLTFICAGDCMDTPHRFDQHSPALCRSLADGDSSEVAGILELVPDYKRKAYRFAESVAACHSGGSR